MPHGSKRNVLFYISVQNCSHYFVLEALQVQYDVLEAPLQKLSSVFSAYKSTNYPNNSDILCFVTRHCKASDLQTQHEPGSKVHLPVRLTGRIHMLFSISPPTKMANHVALFCWRACHRPRTGFSFNTLSTSATQLLPTAIYYRQIERFQGVSRFVLAVIVQAWYLLTSPPSLRLYTLP